MGLNDGSFLFDSAEFLLQIPPFLFPGPLHILHLLLQLLPCLLRPLGHAQGSLQLLKRCQGEDDRSVLAQS